MEGDLQQILGANVRRFRTSRGMSQEKFAEFLGVHRTYVGAIERGEKNLSLRSIERLAAGLGVDPIALLQTPPGPPPAVPARRAKPSKRKAG